MKAMAGARVHWKQRKGVGRGVGVGILAFSLVKGVAVRMIKSRRGQRGG